MNINWKKLLICLAIPLAVGGLAALLSGGMDSYQVMNQPPLSPPGCLLPDSVFRRRPRRHQKSPDLLRHPAGSEFSLAAYFLWSAVVLGRFCLAAHPVGIHLSNHVSIWRNR